MNRIRELFRFLGKGEMRVPDIPGYVEPDTRETLSRAFSFDFVRALWESEPGKNVFVSPFSVGSVLAMVYGGAEGETKTAMARALRLETDQAAELDRGFRATLDHWQNIPSNIKPQFTVANSLWAERRFPLWKEFIERAERFYDAAAEELDFAEKPERSIEVINSWVSKKTGGRIPSIIESVSSETRLVLANAVYFKGLWDEDAKFDRKKTKAQNFYLLDGSEKQVPMMRRSNKNELPYFRGDGFQAVILPYMDATFEMILFLPDERSGLETFIKNMESGSWDRWIGAFKRIPGEIALPRFKLECSFRLNYVLSVLGMGIAFNPEADFSGICPGQTWISDVLHRAFLDVYEEGSEAAAATVTEMLMGISLPLEPPQRFLLVFDHPFFCVIRDKATDSILFAGAVVDP